MTFADGVRASRLWRAFRVQPLHWSQMGGAEGQRRRIYAVAAVAGRLDLGGFSNRVDGPTIRAAAELMARDRDGKSATEGLVARMAKPHRHVHSWHTACGCGEGDFSKDAGTGTAPRPKSETRSTCSCSPAKVVPLAMEPASGGLPVTAWTRKTPSRAVTTLESVRAPSLGRCAVRSALEAASFWTE